MWEGAGRQGLWALPLSGAPPCLTNCCGIVGGLGVPPPLPPGHGSHPPSCSRLCVGRSNNGKTAEGGGIPGDGAEAGDRAQAHLPLRPRREPRAGVRGEVRGPGSCPFPWGQHDHTELGTKGPSSRQRPGLCGGGSVPHAEGAGRGLQSEPVSRNPLHLLWTDGRRPLQEVMRAPPGSPLGQGHGPRATGEGAGGQACCVLAPLSSSGPPHPLKEQLSGPLCLCFLWRLPQLGPGPDHGTPG